MSCPASARTCATITFQPYAPRVVASTPEIAATAGLSFAATPLPSLSDEIDTLVVAGGQGVMRAANDSGLVGWVASRGAKARRVASVCIGAFMLGAAGFLDGRRAVTHWEYCDLLASRYPLARIDPDPIFINDGNVWTSAGVHRRDRSGYGAGGGGSRPHGRACRRPASGRVPEAAGRAGAVQRRADPTGVERPLRRFAPLDRRQSGR
jgi:hypothetical protein